MKEFLEKIKNAKSVEEILALAMENGIEMTEEQAKTAYAQLHPTSGEIADDDLEKVVGGLIIPFDVNSTKDNNDSLSDDENIVFGFKLSNMAVQRT